MDWNLKYHLLEVHAPNNSCSNVHMFAVSSPPAQPDARALRQTADLHTHLHAYCNAWPLSHSIPSYCLAARHVRPPPMAINPLMPTRSYFWIHCILTSGGEKKHCFVSRLPGQTLLFAGMKSCEGEDKYGAMAEWYWQGDTTINVPWTGLRGTILIIFTGKTEKCFPTGVQQKLVWGFVRNREKKIN